MKKRAVLHDCNSMKLLCALFSEVVLPYEQEFPYNSGFVAFSIYPSADPYSQAPPAGYIPPTQTAGINAAIQEFYGERIALPQAVLCIKYQELPSAAATVVVN